ncbi:MAG: class II aldolase/adducin family protein [Pseudomonadota bacterium]
MIDEGYTKYSVDWTRKSLESGPAIAALDTSRQRLLRASLIGHDEKHDVGFGNLSIRDGEAFIISGTQTGHFDRTTCAHYARVTAADIDRNRVSCTGAVQASSESMTHAAIYAANPAVGSVVHVHDDALWRASLQSLPATRPETPYGTPEMARELQKLLGESSFGTSGLAVMAGHPGGLIAIGESLDIATQRMLDYHATGSG